MSLRVQDHDKITLHFAIRTQGGANIDSTFNDEPLTFIIGDSTLEPKIERWLIDLALNERHVFILTPDLAYGEHDAQLLQNVPIDEFHDAPPVVGNYIEFELPDGDTLGGYIARIEEHDVTIDFNHILAGKTVEFEVEVITIHGRTS